MARSQITRWRFRGAILFLAYAPLVSTVVRSALADSTEATESGTYCTTDSRGNDDPGWPRKPKRDKPGDINRADCPPARYLMSDRERSGCPNMIHKWATTSTPKKYAAGYVGGGAAIGGCRRSREEGTWGLDYRLFDRINPFMKWTKHDREQGGEGAYETDHESHQWGHGLGHHSHASREH